MEHGKTVKIAPTLYSTLGNHFKSEHDELSSLYRQKIRELMLALKSSDLIWAVRAYQSLVDETLLEVPIVLFEELGDKLSTGQVFAAQELAKKLFAIQYAVEALERNNH